jgi:hypothetical protein
MSSCYGLNIKCPQKVLWLHFWFPVGDTSLGSGGSFERWDLTRESGSLGTFL